MLAIIVLFALFSTASAGVFTEDATNQKYLWEGFKKDFGKGVFWVSESRVFYFFHSTTSKFMSTNIIMVSY